MQVLTPDELVKALLDTAKRLGTESPGEEEDIYDALASAFRRLAQAIHKNKNGCPICGRIETHTHGAD